MPHITIEYSANVAQRVDVQQLVDVVHDTALATGLVPADGLRTRAVATQHFAVADRHPDNGYIAVMARLAQGRSAEQRAHFIRAINDALHGALGAAAHRLAISVEINEIDPESRINTNHIRSAADKVRTA
jgi:5-carboxymethyl-2-hydroxymuconate isomerase